MAEQRRPDDGAEAAGTGAAEAPLPAIDFSTFILSLSTTALYQLGLVPEAGASAKIEPDLVVAEQTIDTLEMLREKTRGNLEGEEQKLLDSLLYELRLHFVQAGGGRGKG